MQAGVLRVTTGRVWVTTDQMREDYFLHAGELLAIDAGVHVVIEAWNQNKSGLALLDWLEDAPTN